MIRKDLRICEEEMSNFVIVVEFMDCDVEQIRIEEETFRERVWRVFSAFFGEFFNYIISIS